MVGSLCTGLLCAGMTVACVRQPACLCPAQCTSQHYSQSQLFRIWNPTAPSAACFLSAYSDAIRQLHPVFHSTIVFSPTAPACRVASAGAIHAALRPQAYFNHASALPPVWGSCQ